MKDHSISVYQARYATSIVAKYLDTETVKTSTKFYKTTLPSDMISTKADASISDWESWEVNVGNLTFTTELVLDHLCNDFLQDWIWVLQCTS